jgi:hypothetical protein
LELDGAGAGEYRAFRNDGTLKLCCVYRDGARTGPFTIYHPNGELAREGRLVDGLLDGVVLAHRSDCEGAEALRACCVPDSAFSMRSEYRRGALLNERFFDAEGRLLLSDGRVAPARPRVLPEHAQYDEVYERWCLRDSEASLELLRFFDAQGQLVQEDAYRDGQRVRLRTFTPGAGLSLEEHFDAEGRLHGARRVRYADAQQSPDAERRLAEELAHFDASQPVGLAEFVFRCGERRRFERGALFSEDDLEHVVFDSVEHGAEAWLRLAEALTAERRMRHAACAAARASSDAGSPVPLEEWLGRHVLRLHGERASELAEALAEGEAPDCARVLSALLLGAEPHVAFRWLAKVLPGRPIVAHSFVDAALLLAPEDGESYWVRAMARLELGRVEEGLDDAARVAKHSEPLASFVRDYARIVFPTWRFSAGIAGVGDAPFDGLSETPLQPLAAIRRVIELYATRLLALRQAVLERLPDSEARAWLPPKLSALLPSEPIELSRYAATIVDVSETGERESSEVLVDETLELETSSLQELQIQARADWAALGWLCWAAGLDEIALPTKLTPRPNFAAAASQAILRAGRLGDVVATGGIRARAQGVPSFSWEGLDVDAMPAAYARLALHEYCAVRSMFLWLCFEENRSPFQSDLVLD